MEPQVKIYPEKKYAHTLSQLFSSIYNILVVWMLLLH